MRQFLTVTLLLVTAFVALTGIASATVINVAYWRGGEDDVPAPSGIPGPADSTAVDAMGNLDLTKTNRGGATGPSYGYSGLPAGSTVDYVFDGATGNAFAGVPPTVAATTNWGVQLYAKPSYVDGVQIFLQAGPSGVDGFILGQVGGNYYAEVAGVWGANEGAVSANVWANIALVNDGGVNKFYVDGVLKASSAANKPSIAPTTFIGLGQNSAGGQNYTGAIDEARIFTFAPGAFQASDLNGYVGIVPEPSTLMLGVTGLLGLLAYAWRKRR